MPLNELTGLYVIIDPSLTAGRDEVEIAREALAGGARLLQLRDKTREKGLQLPIARALRALCRERGAPFIVNDHVDLALAVDADGVHVGQKDLPVSAVRRLVPRGMIVGCSTNNPEEARRAEADGADYVSVGRLFPTGSKQDTRPATMETLQAVKAAVSVPVCAIGGITEANIDEVLAAGADMAAVIAAVIAAADPSAGLPAGRQGSPSGPSKASDSAGRRASVRQGSDSEHGESAKRTGQAVREAARRLASRFR